MSVTCFSSTLRRIRFQSMVADTMLNSLAVLKLILMNAVVAVDSDVLVQVAADGVDGDDGGGRVVVYDDSINVVLVVVLLMDQVLFVNIVVHRPLIDIVVTIMEVLMMRVALM